MQLDFVHPTVISISSYKITLLQQKLLAIWSENIASP